MNEGQESYHELDWDTYANLTIGLNSNSFQMKIVYLLFTFFLKSILIELTDNSEIEDKARKLIDTALPDITPYLDALKPENQITGLFQVQQKRLGYLKEMDRWITQLQAKLDRMKFITNSRITVMGDNLNRRLKSSGFNSVIKYIRLYNKMMLPMTNPYVQMKADNKIYTPPEAQADPSFQSFQKNLDEYSKKYADTLSQWQSGIWEENPKTEKYDSN